MNWLKTLMIVALLAQPLCAVACDLSMAAGQDAPAQAADSAHDCCDGGDDDRAAPEPGSADHCGDCAATATLTVAAAPAASIPGATLPPFTWGNDTPARAPSPRPPNA